MTAKERKRLDGMIALPLDRFRTALKRLTRDELALLETRIGQLTIKQRWALGSHGIDRHRAPNELGLLARRLAETRRAAADRARGAATPLHLVETTTAIRELPAVEAAERAA
jgi:hypothetical protein